MAALYPELAGYVVSAEALMEYIFAHHDHRGDDGIPYVDSLPLERWLRDNARREARQRT